MSRIDEKFKELSLKNEKALIAYFMIGYPDKTTSMNAIKGLINGGADIIEIGFPFSDPLADGPTIQNASTISLKKGTNLNYFYKTVKEIRKQTEIPLVLMTYTNIIYNKGYSTFFSKIKQAGIDGVILPDMSPEESKLYVDMANKKGLDCIFLISPNTSVNRVKKIVKISSGFLYLVAVFGTTGVQSKINRYTITALKKLKKLVNREIPIGIGFGISTPNDVKKYIKTGADAVIVGSAFLKIIDKTPKNKIQKEIAEFTRSLKKQTKLQKKQMVKY
ncbi:MAG: tryptophan synthase subunit alpha [Nitrosopumilaceae archaeon]|nr:tryptophan synthase subunit alpha [Nitrosopumilaceae archaeon]